ncbi:MAG: fibronectin type III domain-containing protein [Candidatus Eisenbacteria bacterium]
MRLATLLPFAMFAVLLAGCTDETVTAPRDITPPAAPRGLYSVTGDGAVTLRWLANTEGDLSGYRIYMSPCENGTDCPYDRQGATTSTSFVVGGLGNGITRYFAIAAIDAAGNESALTYETIIDTPRPAGINASLGNFMTSPTGAGWDFSAASVRSSNDTQTDIYFGYNGGVYQMFSKDVAPALTEIQDAGYATTLDAVDWAPSVGWSPSGTVELIVGHCYVVWTRDDHYAKFRVTSLSSSRVVFDWAYQTDAGNPELAAKRAFDEDQGARPVAWIRK